MLATILHPASGQWIIGNFFSMLFRTTGISEFNYWWLPSSPYDNSGFSPDHEARILALLLAYEIAKTL